METKQNALLLIQSELKVPKGQYNAFGKYHYRSAEDILEAVKPLLKKYNANLILSDEIVQIGTKLFCKSTSQFKVVGADTIISTIGYAELTEHKGMTAEQSSGCSSSYARKYCLNGLFLCDETEADPDYINNNNEQKNTIPAKNVAKKTEAPKQSKPTNPLGLFDLLLNELKIVKNSLDLENFTNNLKEQKSRLTDLELDNLRVLYKSKQAEIELGNN